MTTLERALAYISKLPPAISGSGGHDATLRAACECIRFGLSESETWAAMREYNERCSPQWSAKELAHKIADARQVARPGERTTPANGRGVGRSKARRALAPPDMTKRHTPSVPRPLGNAGNGTQIGRAEIGAQSEPVGAQGKPVSFRSEAEEEAWWARVFAERGITDPAKPARAQSEPADVDAAYWQICRPLPPNSKCAPSARPVSS
jgi:hypothetical protein